MGGGGGTPRCDAESLWRTSGDGVGLRRGLCVRGLLMERRGVESSIVEYQISWLSRLRKLRAYWLESLGLGYTSVG